MHERRDVFHVVLDFADLLFDDGLLQATTAAAALLLRRGLRLLARHQRFLYLAVGARSGTASAAAS